MSCFGKRGSLSRLSFNDTFPVVSDTWKFDCGLKTILRDELHWLDVPEMIEYKLGVMIHRRTRLSTVGDRAFPDATARTWNSLPQHVTSTSSMSVFRGRLKASSSGVPSHDFHRNFCSACAVTFVIFRQLLYRSFYLLAY